MSETPYFDHDLDEEIIRLGNDVTLKINPKGHLPEISDKIVDIADEYDKMKLTGMSVKEEREAKKEANRKILELALVDFDYVDASNKVGYAMLDKVTDFLFVYHVEHGGKEGHKVWRTQLNIITQNQ